MTTLLLALRDGPQATAWHDELQACDGWLVRGPASGVADLRKRLLLQRPTLLVTDLRLRDGSALGLIHLLRNNAHAPSGAARTQVLVLADDDQDPLLLEALQAGADNVHLRGDAARGALTARVLETLAGGADIAPAIARGLLDHFGPAARPRLGVVEDLTNPLVLTAAERQLLRQLSVGERLAELAQREGVLPRELVARVRAIYRKMQWALRAGDLRLA